jgi:hypothetical protein
MSNIEKINTLFEQGKDFLDVGDIKNAIKIGNELKKFATHLRLKY